MHIPNRSADRSEAIARAYAHFDDGDFVETLRRRVAIPSSSQEPEHAAAMRAYLRDEMAPALAPLGFASRMFENPNGRRPPLLVAERIEDPKLVTVLIYGHGDTVRGLDDLWRTGLAPWSTYGRGRSHLRPRHRRQQGPAQHQHRALAAVLAERGRLGFNVKFLIEMGEEVGSAGLRELCEQHKDGALKADLLIASDGPRIAPDQPTLFLGARGGHLDRHDRRLARGRTPFRQLGRADLQPRHRAGAGDRLHHRCARHDQGAGVAAAAAAIGARVLKGVVVDGGEEGPAIEPDWGEPELTPAERVFGWNSFEVLAFTTGTPERPVNAIPGSARAHCQLRYVVGTEATTSSRRCAATSTVTASRMSSCAAARGASSTRAGSIRTIPGWRGRPHSIERTPRHAPTILPNLGGSLPNDLFIDVLGLKTVWMPHSYAGCSQHAPDEHLLAPIAREGLGLMAGLFWDLGEPGTPHRR